MTLAYRRLVIVLFLFVVFFIAIIVRLFYWQILASQKAKSLANQQYRSEKEIIPFRGEIFSQDNALLAGTQRSYFLGANLKQLNQDIDAVASSLAQTLAPLICEINEATEAGKEELIDETKKSIAEKLKMTNLSWVGLQHHLSCELKTTIENMRISGLDFQEEQDRFYPEASMAGQLLGFVGKDAGANDKGYFGIEGYYDLELRGRSGMVSLEKDVLNRPILIGANIDLSRRDGKNLILHLDRTIQYIVETKLSQAIERYGAKSGMVAVMDPFTGGILAMANLPSYDPKKYYLYDKELYKNPLITSLYEPGSTFKIFTMAAGIDKDLVSADTQCDICDKPFKIDKYFIKTWNDKYYPNSTMTQVIEHSDNVGMVFVSYKLGLDNFLYYLKQFGFGEKTGIDLQEEVAPQLKDAKSWSQVDLATTAFGQGIAVTGIQVLRAAAAIANGGNLVEPQVVKEIKSEDKSIKVKPKVIRRVLKEETAKIISQMMLSAVENGEVKWAKLAGFKLAGKTGTAQIPIAGHYDKEKTIASFIGFGPVDKPRFVILVTLTEPTSSPWGSETAGPLFFGIAKEILFYFGIQPDK